MANIDSILRGELAPEDQLPKTPLKQPVLKRLGSNKDKIDLLTSKEITKSNTAPGSPVSPNTLGLGYEQYEEDYGPSPGTPNNMQLDSDPEFSPRSAPSSPKLKSLPSPLLLSVTESPSPEVISPVNSRDEEGAVFSDSDAGSSVNLSRGRRDKKTKSKVSSSKERDESKRRRRRKSDASEGSHRSTRSASVGRESNKNSQTSKILRNLLILEESLRKQLREQKDLRRQYTAFIAILAGLFAFSSYSLFIDIHEPSPFWKLTLRFLLFFIIVTFSLFYIGGDYHRTLVLPRRFFTSTNKGLRQLNLKLVKVNTTYTDLFIDYSRTFLRIAVALGNQVISYTGPFKESLITKWVLQKLKALEIRAQPRVGATEVKLILNPRSFPSEIREAWETYRDEFWSREGSKLRHAANMNISSASSMNRLEKLNDPSSLRQNPLPTSELKSIETLRQDDRSKRRIRRLSKADDVLGDSASRKSKLRGSASLSPSPAA